MEMTVCDQFLVPAGAVDVDLTAAEGTTRLRARLLLVVRTGAAGDFVYVVNEDRTVSMRPVKRGQGTVENIVVTEALKEGERVVTEGGDRLTDGASVRLASDAAARPGAAASAPRNGASGPRREGRRPAQNP